LFLRRSGPLWHPVGGARGVVEAVDHVVAHVQALHTTTEPGALAHLLVAQLDHQEPRIADDAAHALAVLPVLSLAANDRQTVAACLQQALAQRSTRCAPLVDVAVRAADPALVGVLLASYLDSTRDDHAKLMRAGLRRCDWPTVTGTLPPLVDSEQRGVRAAQLLTELPSAESRAALSAVLHRSRHPRVQLSVVEGLLAAGVREPELAAHVPAAVLELAVRRQQARPRFRSIDPSRR